MARQNLAGKKYGRLTAVEEIGFIFYGKRRHAVWRCHCDCGGSTDANVMLLRLGNKRSCGCLVTEKQIASRTHGQSRSENGGPTKEYRAYRGMLNRCYRPTDIEYRNYGGREVGIHYRTLFDRWQRGERGPKLLRPVRGHCNG